MGKTISLFAFMALGAIAALFGLSGIVNLNAGEEAVLVQMIGENKGVRRDTMTAGLSWVNPINNDVYGYVIRNKQYDMSGTEAETNDGQPVVLDLSFEISLTGGEQLTILHEKLGRLWYDQFVWPRARTAIRMSTSALSSDVIYTSEGRKAIRDDINLALQEPLAEYGITIETNVRSLSFDNAEFVEKLEKKASAAQDEEIERRNAAAAEQIAIKVTNTAEGQKQKRIKEAEAEKQEQKLRGEGQRLADEEKAIGILAIKSAEAEGIRLKVAAFGGGATYASVRWAEEIGDNIKVYGVPTGAEGTSSIMDLTGALSGMAALKGIK